MNTIAVAMIKLDLARAYIRDAEEALSSSESDVAYVSIDCAIDKLKDALKLI